MTDTLDREMGLYQCSIATSLAIEGAAHTGERTDLKGQPPIHEFECVWFNLRTLIRNAFNAYESQHRDTLLVDTLIATVEEDWSAVQAAIKSHVPNCEVSLYLCTYDGIGRILPHANFKGSTTGKQMVYESLEKDVMRHFMNEYKETLKEFKWKLNGDKRCVLVTHHPMDLVSASNFPDLLLLESHTGAVKGPKHWWTKLAIKRDGPIIPFNLTMLQIFGDGAMLKPQPLKIRQTLLKISEKRHWHPLTTMSKILQDVQLEYEPHLVTFLRQYQ